jgi:hypothetical protein
MSDYDKEQKTEFVPQHKRIAMGVPLDGQDMRPSSNKTESDSDSQPKGGLSQATKTK